MPGVTYGHIAEFHELLQSGVELGDRKAARHETAPAAYLSQTFPPPMSVM